MKNQFTKRQRWDDRKQPASTDDGRHGVPNVPEVASADAWGVLWDEEWRAHLLQAAVAKVRAEFSATQFQIFDLNVLKEWPAGDVARALGVSLASVYLAKHRVAKAVKQEMARLERTLEEQAVG